MKTISAAAIAIITSGAYYKVELWQITPLGGSPQFYTAGDIPLQIGGNLYQTGLTFTRGPIATQVGLKPSTLDLTIAPQFDLPGGPPLISGGNFIPQCAAGVLDGATWLMSKGFFYPPTSISAGHGFIDTSPGITPWWAGITHEPAVGRSVIDCTLDEGTAYLDQVQMPHNMIQVPCIWTLFDAGCTVPFAQNTYNAQVTSVSGNTILTNMPIGGNPFPDHFFDQGLVTFTSGPLNGVSMTVQSSAHSSTFVTLTTARPFVQTPLAGNAISMNPGCDKTYAQCDSGKFRNGAGVATSFKLAFRGYPYVPNPETLYDGGTPMQGYNSPGSQGGGGAGSPFSGVMKS